MAATAVAAESRPNILWITCEDMGPQLGCYGDANAKTPNLDRLAASGLRYRTVWSNAPVCAPARTTIISGVYPPSTGAEHMRSAVALPETLPLYPTLLREAGYYCTNNSKEDYNIAKPGKIWDESSNKAHWKNRAEGQPFFAIFNDTVTHESGIRRRPHKAVLDPARVRVPAYHPDTSEVRADWAQYYDNIATMDARAGRILAELQEAGLADDTIVFFYGDHGSGMPRSKRWPYNSGLHVAMIVHIPEKFQHLAPPEYKAGGWSDRLVSFVDLAPTLLSLVGNQPPEWMQGHAFMGKHDAGPQPYVYGFRGRMDERYDLVRSVRDARYVYIRNYMPHLIYGQYLSYMFETPTTQVWKDLFDEGSLNAVQARFWQTKPPEELYDLQNDPDEVKNLVDSADHREVLERLRGAQRAWALKIRDVGFLPEPEIHSRSQGSTPYEMGHDAQKYPLERILATAEAASSLKPDALPELHRALNDADSAVRYWGVLGLVMRGEAAVAPAADALRKSLVDESVCVRIAAAEALGRFGSEADRAAVLATLVAAIEKPEAPNASLMALNVIDRMGEKAAELNDRLRPLAQRGSTTGGRAGSYDARIYERLPGKLPKQTPVRGQ
jgi:uncharacterized sulfatase